MVNKVILVGNLGKDPESRFTPSGVQITNFTVATTRRSKEKKTDWHSVTCFNKTAEFAANYLKMGSKVYIEGEVQYESYEKDGVTKYSTKIIANEVQNLSPKDQDGDKAPSHSDSFDDEINF